MLYVRLTLPNFELANSGLDCPVEAQGGDDTGDEEDDCVARVDETTGTGGEL